MFLVNKADLLRTLANSVNRWEKMEGEREEAAVTGSREIGACNKKSKVGVEWERMYVGTCNNDMRK